MPLPKNRKNDVCRRLQRRTKVAALYLAGKSQTQIAAELGTSQMTVCRDLAGLRAEWEGAARGDFAAKQAEELEKLRRVEEESWAAWRRSLEDGESVSTTDERPAPGPDATAAPARRVTELRRVAERRTTRSQAGDAQFLGQVFECVETRLRMIGAPETPAAATVIEINWSQMDGTARRPNPVAERLAALERLPARDEPGQ